MSAVLIRSFDQHGLSLDALTKGDLDFGFVTKKSEDPGIHHEIFAEEEYVLVGKDASLVRDINAKNLNGIPFIMYPGMDVLLEYWRDQYFPKKKDLIL